MKNIVSNNKSKIQSTTRKNIVVWLDVDAYSYINFGIISALSKLDKYDFIGIVATKHDLDFFKNQTTIPFKELIYFPKCYYGKSSYNIEQLNKFEEKYNLNLWLDILTERYFYRFYTFFHKFTTQEILSIVENILSFFENILETFRPELILTQPVGENISNLLLYRLAKSMRMNILMPNTGYIHNKIIITNNLFSEEISHDYQKLIKNYNDSSQKYDEKFIKQHSLKETINLQSTFDNGISTFSQKLHHYTKRFTNDPESIYMNFGKTKSKMIQYRYQHHFKIKKRKQFLDANSIKSIEDKKFLYFPLQSEPEARILVDSSFYSNQIALIENIARSIPIDYVLYVKEHPMQKIKLWRSIDDYQKIIDLPNVKLVHPDVNSQLLISKCGGVISISGATGFEALFYKKPVILFANDYYDVLSMVTTVNDLTELPNIIRNVLNNFQFNNKEFNALMQAYDNQSIPVPYFSMIKDGLVLSSIQRNTRDFNLTKNNFQQFYNTYKNSFELIAKVINTKLVPN
jgi:hypothetical protein